METLLRSLFLWLSHNHWLRTMVTQVPFAYQMANRFFAGETVGEAIKAIRDLQASGVMTTVDILGEEVTSEQEATGARDAYLHLLDEIAAQDVQSDISLKLTQLGLDIDLDFCLQNVADIVVKAQARDVLVCVDMEDSPRTERTIEVWRRLHADHKNVGIAIQAYLYRSDDDMRALCEAGAAVRLCKGAYKEPASVAYPEKAEVDASMMRLAQMMLDATLSSPKGKKPYLAMATHDEKLIRATKAYADRLGVPREAYEFQMLYGIRRDLQEQIVAEGYQMRAYVPFGTEWFPYFMRRMAERPANVWFVLKAILVESPNLVSTLLLAALMICLLSKRRKRK